MACTACGQCMGIASSGDGERNAVRVHARCVSGRPADGQTVASDFKHTSCFLTCKRVLPRESMCKAGEARTHGACVTSVLCTRVLVCKAQSSERRRGSGEAKPGARHASCALFCSLCSRAKTRSVHIPHAASKPHRQPTSPRSWLVLLGPEAALYIYWRRRRRRWRRCTQSR